MAKRQPVRFNELEPKGRGAILRSREEIEAEQGGFSSQSAGMPEVQHSSKLASQKTGGSSSRPISRSDPRGGANRADYPKVTYRISLEALEAVDEAKRLLRRQYGIKVTLEEIAEVAILQAFQDLLEHQHASFLVNKFSGKSDNQNSSE